MHDDFNWFVENYRTLYLLHGHSFLAIKNRKVIGTYRTCAEALAETLKKEPIGTFIIQECNGDDIGYTAWALLTESVTPSMYELIKERRQAAGR